MVFLALEQAHDHWSRLMENIDAISFHVMSSPQRSLLAVLPERTLPDLLRCPPPHHPHFISLLSCYNKCFDAPSMPLSCATNSEQAPHIIFIIQNNLWYRIFQIRDQGSSGTNKRYPARSLVWPVAYTDEGGATLGLAWYYFCTTV